MREATESTANNTLRTVLSLSDVQREQREELRLHRDRLETAISKLSHMPDALHHLAESIRETAQLQKKFAEDLHQTQLDVARLTPRLKGDDR